MPYWLWLESNHPAGRPGPILMIGESTSAGAGLLRVFVIGHSKLGSIPTAGVEVKMNEQNNRNRDNHNRDNHALDALILVLIFAPIIPCIVKGHIICIPIWFILNYILFRLVGSQ